jgi:hypothetical protein
LTSASAPDQRAISAARPKAADKPQHREPLTMPAARASARARPCAIAVPITASTLGPGLATPIAKAR